MNKLKKLTSGITGNKKSKKASNIETTYTASPATHTTITTSRIRSTRTIQNFRLVWLDNSIDEVSNDDSVNTITKLRQVVNAVETFTDVDDCIEFMADIKDEQIFMISSGILGQTTVPLIHKMTQINGIYIYCGNKARHEQWAKEWSKIRGVYTDITSICEALKQAAQDCDRNLVSISFVQTADGAPDENLNVLDQSFMYTQILKEILLTIHFEQVHINEFLTYCREQFAGNSAELENIDQLQKEYTRHQPIWWYTYQCLLYSMLNRALRMMEVDLIIKMGFFLRDLHNNIATLHAEQYGGQDHSNSFIVYRGQGLFQTEFDQLKQTQGGLMSFNNFLSTSLDRAVSLAFAESNQYNPDLIGVLFEITISPSVSTSPFANVENVGYYHEEKEILFSMHSVFRVGQMKQIDKNDRLWQVDLTLTSDNDPQLHALTKRMQVETEGSTGWHRLGQLMIKLGQFNKSEELYEILLKQTTDEHKHSYFFYQLGYIKYNQGEYEKAITFYEKALEIDQKTLSPDYLNLANSYNNIGLVYYNITEYSKALSYYENALEIYKKTLRSNHSDLATSYNNIGLVYNTMGDYSKALSNYEKALEIYQKTLPANHSNTAKSYNNIGGVHRNMAEYSKALSYYEKALEIWQKTLPLDHPDLAISYACHGSVYDKMGEHLKALSYYEKALEIRQKTLPANHPSLAKSCNSIGAVYYNMGNYQKALSYYEKDLEIMKKFLAKNHPDLAQSYNNIGVVYDNMRQYSEALSYFEFALDIWEHSSLRNQPNLERVRKSIEIIKKKL